jgi:prepilin-type N-terminal cleavage/methylation domain-containing protein
MLKLFSRNPQYAPRAQAGFTLVEMSVVLLVIGMILGAVSIGKDLQRDAEYTKIKQKFIDPWSSAYNSYYSRTGVVLGDSQTAPSYMVNGTASAGVSSKSGEAPATEPAAICDSTEVNLTARAAPIATLYDEMDRHGVRMPPGRTEGKEARYVYLDSNGNPQEIQVCFQWNKPATSSNSGNVMVISGLTPDIARALDQMIDGKADAQEGMFRQAGLTHATFGVSGVEWAGNNTEKQVAARSGASAAVTDASRKDEDQVLTVIAHYKMNQ